MLEIKRDCHHKSGPTTLPSLIIDKRCPNNHCIHNTRLTIIYHAFSFHARELLSFNCTLPKPLHSSLHPTHTMHIKLLLGLPIPKQQASHFSNLRVLTSTLDCRMKHVLLIHVLNCRDCKTYTEVQETRNSCCVMYLPAPASSSISIISNLQ